MNKNYKYPPNYMGNFWAKVIKGPSCWIWRGSKHFNGYLAYGICTYEGKQQRAHRVSWKRTHGIIPKGLFVLHKCDIPLCVNPKHLYLGTHIDNMRDRSKHKRVRNQYTGKILEPLSRPEKVRSLVSMSSAPGASL